MKFSTETRSAKPGILERADAAVLMADGPGTVGAAGNRTGQDSNFGAQERTAQRAEGTIGEILQGARRLSALQVDQILQYQKLRRMPFGEAAVALHLASHEDVMWALSQQFEYTYTPPVGNVGSAELAMARLPFGAQAEAFRELRSQLMMGVLAGDQARRALAVVSPDRGDGKTFIAANLAVAFSQLGSHTLLIDADMRAPRQHALFGVDNGSGLSNVLSGRSEANVIRSVPSLPKLFVLPVGVVPPNPLELVQRSAFAMLVHELLTRFQYVVVDTPAASVGPDARVVASKCGAALVIGRKGSSRLDALHKLVDTLTSGPSALAGVVINER